MKHWKGFAFFFFCVAQWDMGGKWYSTDKDTSWLCLKNKQKTKIKQKTPKKPPNVQHQIRATTLESTLKKRLKRLQNQPNKASWICNMQNYYRNWGDTRGFQRSWFPFDVSNDRCQLRIKGWTISPLVPSLWATSSCSAPFWICFLSFQDIKCCPCVYPALSRRIQLVADSITSWAHHLIPERIYLPTSLVQVASKENLSEKVKKFNRTFLNWIFMFLL